MISKQCRTTSSTCGVGIRWQMLFHHDHHNCDTIKKRKRNVPPILFGPSSSCSPPCSSLLSSIMNVALLLVPVAIVQVFAILIVVSSTIVSSFVIEHNNNNIHHYSLQHSITGSRSVQDFITHRQRYNDYTYNHKYLVHRHEQQQQQQHHLLYNMYDNNEQRHDHDHNVIINGDSNNKKNDKLQHKQQHPQQKRTSNTYNNFSKNNNNNNNNNKSNCQSTGLTCRVVTLSDSKLDPNTINSKHPLFFNKMLHKMDTLFHAMAHSQTRSILDYRMKQQQLQRQQQQLQQTHESADLLARRASREQQKPTKTIINEKVDKQTDNESDSVATSSSIWSSAFSTASSSSSSSNNNAKEQHLVRTIRTSLEDGGYQLLTQRDLDLCNALNTGYLLRLSIVPDITTLDPSIGSAFYPELYNNNNNNQTTMNGTSNHTYPLLFDGRVLVYWRGYNKEVTKGRMLLEKLDYIQSSIVQCTINSIKDRLEYYYEHVIVSTIQSFLRKSKTFFLRTYRNLVYTLFTGSNTNNNDSRSNKNQYQKTAIRRWQEQLKRNLLRFVSNKRSMKTTNHQQTNNSNNNNSNRPVRIFDQLGRYGGGNSGLSTSVRFVGTGNRIENPLNPFMICEETYNCLNGSTCNKMDTATKSSVSSSSSSSSLSTTTTIRKNKVIITKQQQQQQRTPCNSSNDDQEEEEANNISNKNARTTTTTVTATECLLDDDTDVEHDDTTTTTSTTIDQDIYTQMNTNQIRCLYDDVMRTNECNDNDNTMQLLERVSISNLIEDTNLLKTKNGRQSVVRTIVSKSILVEPTYEEVIVIWRPLVSDVVETSSSSLSFLPNKKKNKNKKKFKMTIPNVIYEVADMFDFEDILPERKDKQQQQQEQEQLQHTKEDLEQQQQQQQYNQQQQQPLQLRAYEHVPMANIYAIMPQTKLLFRPADALRFDLISLISFVAVATSIQFENPKLDILAIASVSLWLIRTIIRYSNKLARYDLVVKTFLMNKVSYKNNNVIQYLINEGYKQRSIRSVLVYWWLRSKMQQQEEQPQHEQQQQQQGQHHPKESSTSSSSSPKIVLFNRKNRLVQQLKVDCTEFNNFINNHTDGKNNKKKINAISMNRTINDIVDMKLLYPSYGYDSSTATIPSSKQQQEQHQQKQPSNHTILLGTNDASLSTTSTIHGTLDMDDNKNNSNNNNNIHDDATYNLVRDEEIVLQVLQQKWDDLFIDMYKDDDDDDGSIRNDIINNINNNNTTTSYLNTATKTTTTTTTTTATGSRKNFSTSSDTSVMFPLFLYNNNNNNIVANNGYHTGVHCNNNNNKSFQQPNLFSSTSSSSSKSIWDDTTTNNNNNNNNDIVYDDGLGRWE